MINRAHAYCVLSGYRSKCPVCDKGVLLVRRSTTNMVLEPADNCLFCEQPFVYDDIESLRTSDGFVKKLHRR